MAFDTQPGACGSALDGFGHFCPPADEKERAQRGVSGVMKRWRLGLVVGGATMSGLGALAFVGVIVSRPSSPAPTTALGAPHFVDETATAGVDQVYDGGPTFAVGGGVAAFDCNDDGKPTCTSPAGAASRALPQRQSGRRRLEVHPAARSGDRPGQRERRLPDRHRWRRSGRPGGPAQRRDRHSAWSRRVSVRTRQRSLVFRRRQRLDHGLQCHLGGFWRVSTADARHRPLSEFGGIRCAIVRLRGQRARPSETRWHWLCPAHHPDARVLHAVGPVQRLGPLRTARPEGDQ